MPFRLKLFSFEGVHTMPFFMKPSVHIQAELLETAPELAKLASPVMPHHVPEGYFEALPANMLRQVGGHAAPSVPEGYFENLPLLMLQKVRQHEVSSELESIAPLLNTISKAPVHYVPEGYFEQLTPVRTAPAVKMGSLRMMVGRAMPYAAAACLALAMWVGYNWIGKSPAANDTALNNTESIEQALQQIDDQTISNYLESNSTVSTYASLETVTSDVETLIQTMDSEDLENYLKNMPTLVNTEKTDM
jgi:hypothetical protein